MTDERGDFRNEVKKRACSIYIVLQEVLHLSQQRRREQKERRLVTA